MLKIQKRTYFLFFLFFSIAGFVIGQRKVYSDKNIKKLKEVAPENASKIYIKSKFTESGDIGIFLINRSDTTIEKFLGYDQNIQFAKEARDVDGNWKEIDTQLKPLIYCFTGSSMIFLKLLPDHYTWDKFYKRKYHGEYETFVRFSYRLPDSTLITSNSLKANINPDLFLPPFERSLKFLDLLILSDTITENHRVTLKRKRLQLYNRHSTIEKTVALSEKFVQEHPESEIALYGLATHYIRYISKNRENLNKAEIQVLLSKAIGLWEQIKNDNSIFSKKAQKWIKKYNLFLLSKNEWLALEENKLQQIGNDYYGNLPISNKERVKIRFKSD